MSEMEAVLGKPRLSENGLKLELTPEVSRARTLLLDPRAIAETNCPLELVKIQQEIDLLNKSKTSIDSEIQFFFHKEREGVQALLKLQEEMGKLKADLKEHEDKFFTKILRVFGIADSKKFEMEDQAKQITLKEKELDASLTSWREDISNLKRELECLPQPQTIGRGFEEKMLSRPLSQDEKIKLLKPEVLSTLSVDEFFILWRRLDPWFVSHVTRHGIRDHNSMWEHSAGLEDWHDSASKIFESDGRLLTPFAAQGLGSFSAADIEGFLAKSILKSPTRQEAKETFNATVNASLAIAPNYPDKTAVHFAVQTVLDDYYGGESGNEIFFVIPADVIASQHLFHSSKFDLDRPDENRKFNDLFVWPADHQKPFISANNGICFLPKSTLVDPETGSKYATQLEVVDGITKRIPIKDQIICQKFSSWVESISEAKGIVSNIELLKSEQQKLTQLNQARYSSRGGSVELEYQFRDQSRLVDASAKYLQTGIESELGKIGMPVDCIESIAEKVTKVAINARDMDQLIDNLNEAFVSQMIDKFKLEFRRADLPITAEEFWRGHFEKNPTHSPARIIFYDGSPTQAVRDCLIENDVGSPKESHVSEESNIDESPPLNPFDAFEQNNTDMPYQPTEHRVYAGHAELMRIGNLIIEAYFQ